MHTTRIISIVNQKGGVGKTTTAVSLAAGLAGFHRRPTLLVDMDSQANATLFLGKSSRSAGARSTVDVLTGACALAEARVPVFAGLDLLPGSLHVAGFTPSGYHYSHNPFGQGQGAAYDFIVIDCPPSLGPLTVLPLAWSTEVLIPVQAQYLALEGTARLFDTLRLVRQRINPHLAVLGVLCTMFSARSRMSFDALAKLRSVFGDLVFETVVTRDLKLEEVPAFGMSVFEYAKNSKGSVQYYQLTLEVLQRGDRSVYRGQPAR